jgi:hypothetical protein
MRRLYSPVKRRRVAFSVTSVSGLPGPKLITFVIAHASLALLGFNSILGGGGCLTIVGTEGELVGFIWAIGRTTEAAALHDKAA